jgi:hypothetical protein
MLRTAPFGFSRVFILLTGLQIVLLGCAANRSALLPEYRDICSVSIPYVKNKTYEPGIEEDATDVLVQEFQRDGRFQVKDVYDADLIIDAVITSYRLQPYSLDAADRATTWNIAATMQFTVTDRATGEVRVNQRSFSASGLYALSQLPDARRKDEVFREIVEKFISACFEGW